MRASCRSRSSGPSRAGWPSNERKWRQASGGGRAFGSRQASRRIDFPRGGGDRLVVEIRQIHQPHDGRQVAAEQLQAAPRGQNARRTDVNAVLHPMAEQHRDQPRHAVARSGLGHKPRGNVAHRRGMAEVFPHELFDRQQAGLGPIAAQLGNAELVGPIEHVGRLPGVEVQLVPQPQQKLAGPLHRAQVFLAEHSRGVQFAGIGRPVTDETDPADQLDVAQRALRPFDVRLQQEHRLAIAMLLLRSDLSRMPAMSRRARRCTWRRNRRR